MSTAEFAASVTAFAAVVTAIVAAVGLRATFRQVKLAREQLEALADTRAREARSERKRETVRVCQLYTTDPILNEHERRIFEIMRDASRSDVPDVAIRDKLLADRRSVRAMLNYFDMIAIGVASKVYVYEIVEDYLGAVIDGYVRDFVDHYRIVEGEGLEEYEALTALVRRLRPPPAQPKTLYTDPEGDPDESASELQVGSAR